MRFVFSGKKILVTGAGRGIGRRIAEALHDAGGTVFALSRTASSLESLTADRPRIVPMCVDLIDWENTRHELEKLEALDGLVNNAAVNEYLCPALDVPKDYIDKVLEVNLKAAINCIQVVGKKMVENRKTGSIVNVSSVGSMQALNGALAYRVAKAGLDMVTKQFALELGPHNIRVNSVNPTMVKTDMIKNLTQASKGNMLEAAFLERTPLGRVATLQEVVDPVLYLLSDLSTMVTGTCHLVDGGLLCNITTKT